MSNLDENIFGAIKNFNGLDIYPVKVRDYKDFKKIEYIFATSEQEFISTIKNQHPNIITDGLLLFDFLPIEHMKLALKITTKKDFAYNKKEKSFVLIDDVSIDDYKPIKINSNNFDIYKLIVMKQNLIHEKVFFEDEELQEKYDRTQRIKERRMGKIEFQDMVQTIRLNIGSSYDEILDYTIYQFKADFSRIMKREQWNKTLSEVAGGRDVKRIDPYWTSLELDKDPKESFGFVRQKDAEALSGNDVGSGMQKIFK